MSNHKVYDVKYIIYCGPGLSLLLFKELSITLLVRLLQNKKKLISMPKVSVGVFLAHLTGLTLQHSKPQGQNLQLWLVAAIKASDGRGFTRVIGHRST